MPRGTSPEISIRKRAIMKLLEGTPKERIRGINMILEEADNRRLIDEFAKPLQILSGDPNIKVRDVAIKAVSELRKGLKIKTERISRKKK